MFGIDQIAAAIQEEAEGQILLRMRQTEIRP